MSVSARVDFGSSAAQFRVISYGVLYNGLWVHFYSRNSALILEGVLQLGFIGSEALEYSKEFEKARYSFAGIVGLVDFCFLVF